jgi:hypothetical protein
MDFELSYANVEVQVIQVWKKNFVVFHQILSYTTRQLRNDNKLFTNKPSRWHPVMTTVTTAKWLCWHRPF